MLMAAMNPGPCGYFNVGDRPCTCGEKRVKDYFNRISARVRHQSD